MSGRPKRASGRNPRPALAEPGTRKRLDILLTDSALARTRSHARDLIARGHVSVDGEVVHRPATLVDEDARLEVAEGAANYVSRSAVKLAAALDAFGFDPSGRHALDIGASTGGFTQVLLERGAAHVTAVDVGRGQLDFEIARDLRVTALEDFDARDLTEKELVEKVTVIVADVSFISVTKVLPAALALAAQGCWLVALVKPQFEVGPDGVGKRGVVRDEVAQARAVANVLAWMESQYGWSVTGEMRSPIRGKGGNQEFLIGATFDVDQELFSN